MLNYLLPPKKKRLKLQALLRYKAKLAEQDPTLEQRVNYFGLSQLILSYTLPFFYYPICHLYGFHLWLLVADNTHTESFVAEFHHAMISTISRLQENRLNGLTIPKLVIEAVIQQCENFQNMTVPNFAILRSLQAFLVYLKQDYVKNCRKSIGVQAANEDFYHCKIFHETTLNLSALQVHLIGLQEIRATTQRMATAQPQTVTRSRNFSTVDVEQKIEVRIVKDRFLPSFMYTFSPVGHGTSTLVINMTKYKYQHLHCLFSHEIYPGHHMEVCHNFNQWYGTDTWWLTNFNSYIEGWGLYCEQLDNNSQEALQLELLRDVRMVVDTGIHSKKCGCWSYLEAFTFMKSGTFRGRKLVENFTGLDFCEDETIHAEILSIISKPAYALTYKLGKLFFQYHCQKQLSRGKSIQDINDIFLSRRVPLPMMGELFELGRTTRETATEVESILLENVTEFEKRMLADFTFCCH